MDPMQTVRGYWDDNHQDGCDSCPIDGWDDWKIEQGHAILTVCGPGACAEMYGNHDDSDWVLSACLPDLDQGQEKANPPASIDKHTPLTALVLDLKQLIDSINSDVPPMFAITKKTYTDMALCDESFCKGYHMAMYRVEMLLRGDDDHIGPEILRIQEDDNAETQNNDKG